MTWPRQSSQDQNQHSCIQETDCASAAQAIGRGNRLRDLEIWVRGHSMSLKLLPFESLGALSCIDLPF